MLTLWRVGKMSESASSLCVGVEGGRELVEAAGHVGELAGELGLHGGGAEEEEARVPEVGAALQVGAGGVEVGFFDEALDVEGDAAAGEVADVAVAGLGARGADAEGDDDAGVLGGLRGGVECALEALWVADVVVGGEDADDGVLVRAAARDEGGGEADAGCGVAGCGLGEDVLARDLGEGAVDGLQEVLAGDDDDVLGWDEG
jgi:hypothetical protein